MYLLDTNACIRILNGSSPTLANRLRAHRPSELRICAIVKAELIYGAYKSSKPAANLRLLDRFFAPFHSLPFDDGCAVQFGIIRQDLERTGSPIGPYDMLIAATALAGDLVLVTHNTREFSRIPGLHLEDWE